MYSEQQRRESIATMAAAARDAFGPDCPIEITPTGIRFPKGMGIDANTRPGESRLQRLIANPIEGDAFLERNDHTSLSSSLKCNLLRARADVCLKKREYRKAAETYLSAAEAQCGTTLPPRGTRSRIYAKLDVCWGVEDLVACLTGAAKALMEMGDYAQVRTSSNTRLFFLTVSGSGAVLVARKPERLPEHTRRVAER